MPERYTKPFPLLTLKELLANKKINIQPYRQRQSVWTKPQRQLLIDSILRDYDVPKLYFRDVSQDGYKYEVVDGHQRLDSIFKYFNDDFALDSDADNVNGEVVKGKKYSKLPVEIQMQLHEATFDVVVLKDYSEDQTDDMFERLQNGTPLNAAEKRRVLAGNMRKVVTALAGHKALKEVADFDNKRYAFEDVAAKLLVIGFAGRIVDTRAPSIKRAYLQNKNLTDKHKVVERVKKILNYLSKALKKRKLKLKKFAFVSVPALILALSNEYDILQRPEEFGKAYEDFEKRRLAYAERDDDDDEDPDLDRYQNSARNDSVDALTFIDAVLRRAIISGIPGLETLDPQRDFTEDQRMLIWLRDNKTCKDCGRVVDLTEFHADHIKPHSRGGKTTVLNGQVLCITCSTKKGKKFEPISMA